MPARHAASMFHLCLVVFVTGVGVSFDFSFTLYNLAMCSTCLLFDFHSDPCRLHLLPLHEMRFPVISPPYHVGLIRGMITVSECAIWTHPAPFDSASQPLEGKVIPWCTTTHPWFSRDVSRWDANIQLTRQDALDLFPTLVCLMFVPCRHASPDSPFR